MKTIFVTTITLSLVCCLILTGCKTKSDKAESLEASSVSMAEQEL